MSGGADAGATRPDRAPSRVPGPGRPVLVSGLVGFVMLNGAGEWSYVRETRGAPVDWGGAYSQCVRLTGPWLTHVRADGNGSELGRSTIRSLLHTHGGMESDHVVAGLTVHDEVRLPFEGRAICRTLSVGNPSERPVRAEIDLGFDPFLAPVAMEGIKPREYRAERDGAHWRVRSFGFALTVETHPEVETASAGGSRWSGERREGTVGPIGFRWRTEIAPGATSEFHVRIVGGLLDPTFAHRGPPLAEEQRRPAIDRTFADWEARAPRLAFPDAPGLEAGYRSARAALRRLYAEPDPSIAGLVAGFPWYAAVWGRDLAWMLPAVEWLGDSRWVERSIATAFRFQARASIPVLGGRPGEVPMQVAPGPVFLYGTSDTTLYYPGIVRRHVDHTGSLDFARSVRPNLERALAWGLDKVDPATGLLTHGGEVAAMRRETEVGEVRVGIDAADTTIWDSTDRRAHAIDVEVLWLEALDSMAALDRAFGSGPAAALEARAGALRAALAARYWWPEEGYAFDTIGPDGGPVPKVRPNALRGIGRGIWNPDEESAIVERARAPDLSTPWGVRTLSNRDPTYDPHAYHDGQVWTIATAWAADAALRSGAFDLGVDYLSTIARRFDEEGGYAAECYDGDRPEPFDACFLLGFSVAPFLSILFETLWGITPKLSEGAIEIRPRFPSRWRSATADGIRLGNGTLSLAWRDGSLTTTWTGPGPVELRGAWGKVRAEPGVAVALRTG